jgi:CTP:molybdopterin cytidylyltransferase MocA/SAM-dependent methyltransferase
MTGSGVVAVVLAAGAGSRFGGGKLLATLEGRPVLQHVLDRLADANLADVVVVLGDDTEAIGAAIDWRRERRVRNDDPNRGLSSSLRVGIEALDAAADAALIVLGDQPLVSVAAIRAVLDATPEPSRPIVVPVYAGDGGRNPVLLGREAFPLIAETTGDRGLGPLIEAHPELVREVAVDVPGGNPDVDTRADLTTLLETAWAARVRANADQVDRFRETPDGTDFYAPVSGLFRADPTRTDDPALDALLRLVQPGDRWLDIGAGAGRYALPIARALAQSGGEVVAVDPSASMLDALREIAAEHGIDNVRTVEMRWPPADSAVPADSIAPAAPAPAGSTAPAPRPDLSADVALIAHVSYDIEAIGPFVEAMESSARRLCVAILMERQPASIADVCWPPVHGEARVPLPALPEFVELLQARGREPSVEHLEREPRRFASRDELEGLLRRQLWVEPGGEADRRFRAALDDLVQTGEDGAVGLVGQRSLLIGIVTWAPGEPE